MELDYDKHIEEFNFIDSISRTGNPGGDLPIGKKAIMQVTQHSVFNSNFDDKNRRVKIDSETTIKLIGNKTPNSVKLKNAYISFVDSVDKLRPPKYVESRETVYFWMQYKNLDAVLKALHEPLVYCWIGRFGDNGDLVYGDIHTDHIHKS